MAADTDEDDIAKSYNTLHLNAFGRSAVSEQIFLTWEKGEV
jgi:hypothetical protein